MIALLLLSKKFIAQRPVFTAIIVLATTGAVIAAVQAFKSSSYRG
jgi:hypothetical protein